MGVDFGFDEDAKIKAQQKNIIDKAKEVASRCLARSRTSYVNAKGAPGSYLAGKAIAYFEIFEDLAKAMNLSLQNLPVIPKFKAELATLIPLPGVGSTKEIVVRHLRDPEGVKAERERLDLRKIEISRPKDDTRPDVVVLSDIDLEDLVRALVKLRFTKSEAVERAKKVYRADASLEDMIGEACRV